MLEREFRVARGGGSWPCRQGDPVEVTKRWPARPVADEGQILQETSGVPWRPKWYNLGGVETKRTVRESGHATERGRVLSAGRGYPSRDPRSVWHRYHPYFSDSYGEKLILGLGPGLTGSETSCELITRRVAEEACSPWVRRGFVGKFFYGRWYFILMKYRVHIILKKYISIWKLRWRIFLCGNDTTKRFSLRKCWPRKHINCVKINKTILLYHDSPKKIIYSVFWAFPEISFIFLL